MLFFGMNWSVQIDNKALSTEHFDCERMEESLNLKPFAGTSYIFCVLSRSATAKLVLEDRTLCSIFYSTWMGNCDV